VPLRKPEPVERACPLSENPDTRRRAALPVPAAVLPSVPGPLAGAAPGTAVAHSAVTTPSWAGAGMSPERSSVFRAVTATRQGC